jgi:hypothetical protein
MNQINQVIGYFYFNKLIKYNLASFYPFKTIDDHQFSLTSSYNIPVFDLNENKIKIICAEKVTIKHRLIMFGKYIQIKNISINIRQGFYSPLSLTSNLFVNNISTSIFSDK